MKICSSCSTENPIADYAKKSTGRDGREAICKRCRSAISKAHYVQNKESYLKRVGDNNRLRKKDIRSFYWLQKDKPCTDCGVKYQPWIMHFDHLDATEKEKDVSKLAGNRAANKNRILAEIAKCELVCANCHADRTYKRMLQLRSPPTD